MDTISVCLRRTVEIIGPGCVTLWDHRENGPDPWDEATRRKYIWQVAHEDWGQWIFQNTDLKLEVVGLGNFDHSERFVITPNHASWVDIAAMVAAYPSVFAFSCKKELLRWPLVGQVIKHGGQVILDRKKTDQAIKALSEGVDPSLDTSVLVFPEGTRTRDGKLQEFKKGAFWAAQNSGLRILPVGIKGSFQALPKGPLWKLDTSSAIEVRFGKPIPLDSKTVEDLRDETYLAVQELLSHP